MGIHADRTTHELNQAFRDREAEPGAAELSGGRTVALREWLKQPGGRVLTEPDPTVLDGKFQNDVLVVRAEQLGFDRDVPLRGELDGVAGQIDQDLAQPA